MNTTFFQPRRQPNAVIMLLERARRPFAKLQRKAPEAEPAHPSPRPSCTPLHSPVHLSPGTYQPREENTAFLDRATAVRNLVARHLGMASDPAADVVLSPPAFARESLLALAAAVDLQFGVYPSAECFEAGLTVEQLTALALAR